MALVELSPVAASCVASVGRDDDRSVVWFRGEHDLSTQDALSETIAGAFALDDADVVLDLSGVEFMGAATVGLIVRAGEFLRLRSRCLALRAPSMCARRILDLCGPAASIEPRPGDVTGLTGPAGELGTWVAVPSSVAGARELSSAVSANPRMSARWNVGAREGP